MLEHIKPRTTHRGYPVLRSQIHDDLHESYFKRGKSSGATTRPPTPDLGAPINSTGA